MFARAYICKLYRNAIYRFADEPDQNDLSRSAIIFAPHQDDETLGCGGTIIKKKNAGADVKIVYLTDGSNSHPYLSHLVSGEQLKEMRKHEAISAGRVLGVDEADITFLGFQDGNLGQYQDEATQKIIEILERYRPDDIFIPYEHDQTPDHLATHKIVLAALQKLNTDVTVYEYPIWIWHLWPWTNPLGAIRAGSWRRILINHIAFGFGLRLLKEFKSSVFIHDVLEDKRLALNQHKSQMTQLVPDPQWLTLADVSNGEFLSCFFQESEIFRRYKFTQGKRLSLS